MTLDDDADDDDDALRPPLPLDDRLWRHPSEIGLRGLGGATVEVVPARADPRGGPWSGVLVAGLAGAVLMAGILTLSGQLTSDVVERPVVEKVAVTPIVSLPMLKGDAGVAAVVRRVQPAIVRLEVSSSDGTTRGSGVVFRDDGMVLTSARLLEDATRVSVRLHDGRRLAGTVVGSDPTTDVAVVDVDANGLAVAVLGTARDLEVGAGAMAIGCPDGNSPSTTVATGVISALRRSIGTPGGGSLHGLLQTDVPIPTAAAGGALVDTSGAVIGIVTPFEADQADDRFSFATPIDLAHRVALQLMADGHASHGWLGVEGEDLSPDEASTLGVPGGARVRRVDQGGPADQAGLDDDDVITDVDGQEVESMPGLVTEIREHKPGDEVEVGYWRDGRRETTDVEVGERP